jgi:peptide/nickel transport system permease protein
MLLMIGKRLASGVVVLLVLIAVVFALRQTSPVNPARAIVGQKASASVVAAESRKLGLDKPIVVQYVNYVDQLVHGDLGESAVTHRPIMTDLSHYLPATAELVLTAFALASALGLLFGIVTAQGWRGSGVLRVVMILGSSLPVFLTALLGIIFLYKKLGWLPATGDTAYQNAPSGPTGLIVIDAIIAGKPAMAWDGVIHLILPATCLALAPAVSIGRVLRSGLQNTMRSDYVRTARAKGQRELRVLVSHGLRNSAGPALAIGGIQIAGMFASVLVLEQIFGWPGLGNYAVQAIDIGDYATIAAVTLTLGALYIVANIVVDLLQAAADPRIRL